MNENANWTIGLDLGTSHVKAVVVDDQGAAACTSSAPSSRDARQLWDAACHALRDVSASIDPRRLAGLGLSGAMHSIVELDGSGQPIGPASTWEDQRGAVVAEQLRHDHRAAELYHRTGCPPLALYHPARLRAAPTGGPLVALKDIVAHRLAGRWCTDWSLASATGLLDIHRRRWDEAALELAGITAAQLPELVSPTTVIGALTPEAAGATGLPAGLPVIAGGSDGALANLGAGAGEAGQVVVTVGTSAAVRVVRDVPRFDPLARTWCHVVDERRWLCGCALNNGGSALETLRQREYGDDPPDVGYAKLWEEAGSVAPGADGLTVVPFFMPERGLPFLPTLKATESGRRAGHGRAHVVRATVEGLACALAGTCELVEQGQSAVLLTGGLSRQPLWARILADVLDRPVEPVHVADASALGAALLVRQALGFKSIVVRSTGAVVRPDPALRAAYEWVRERFERLTRAGAALGPA